MFYGCDISETKEMSYVWSGAGRYHPYVSGTASLENMVHGRKRANRLLAAKTKTRRQVQSLNKIDGLNSKRGQRHGGDQELGKKTRLLSQLSLGGSAAIPGRVEW